MDSGKKWISYEDWRAEVDWQEYMKYLPIMLQNGYITLKQCIEIIKNYGRTRR